MVPRIIIDQATLDQLDKAGKELKLHTLNTPQLISRFCGKAVECKHELEKFLDYLTERVN